MIGLGRCIAVQFTPDGGHIEGCPNYHNLCVEFLARFVAQARIAGRPVAPETMRLFASATEHTVHATRTNGSIVPWGDSFPVDNWITALMRAAAATRDTRCLQQMGTVLGGERITAACVEELWVIDDPEAFLARLATPPDPPLRLWRHDRANDQLMMRSGWDRDALSVFFACHSPLHPKSGHAHVDLGGFELSAFGRPLVADPGPFTYREGDDRRTFKSAQYHSVLTIDGREPFEYLNRWRYSPQKPGRVSAVQAEDGQVRVESFHLNYAPAICHRTVALLAGGLLVVIDSVAGLAPTSTVQIYYHLDFVGVAWSERTRQARAEHEGIGLSITPSSGLGCELLPGRVSNYFDLAHPSTRVRFSDAGGAARRTFAAVLVPFQSARDPGDVANLRLDDAARQCRFTFAGKSYDVAYSRAEPASG